MRHLAECQQQAVVVHRIAPVSSGVLLGLRLGQHRRRCANHLQASRWLIGGCGIDPAHPKKSDVALDAQGKPGLSPQYSPANLVRKGTYNAPEE